MKKWKERWNEMLPYEKKFEVASYVLICPFAVFFVLDILAAFGVLTIAFDAFVISTVFGALTLGCQTVVCWRKERNTAILAMIMGIWWGLDVIWEIAKLFI